MAKWPSVNLCTLKHCKGRKAASNYSYLNVGSITVASERLLLPVSPVLQAILDAVEYRFGFCHLTKRTYLNIALESAAMCLSGTVAMPSIHCNTYCPTGNGSRLNRLELARQDLVNCVTTLDSRRLQHEAGRFLSGAHPCPETFPGPWPAGTECFAARPVGFSAR